MTGQAVLAIVLSGFGREALTAGAGLLLALFIAIAFTVSSVAALWGGMPFIGVGGDALPDIPAGERSRVAVALARTQIGMPYVWGGADPATSFDCSGLVQWVYGRTGVLLPRTAQEQYHATLRVPPDRLEPGDLVFFALTYPAPAYAPITHVGIYVGGGWMINAPTAGDVIRETPVFSGYWGSHYAGAGRVKGPVAIEGVQRPEQETLTTRGG